MNSSEALSPALKPPPPIFEAALEAVELELALAKRDTKIDLCEEIIRETVESVGGILMFQMKLGEGTDTRWLGAVAFNDGERTEYAVINVPSNGSAISVTPAAQSDLPIASIAAAYAGLALCWPGLNGAGTRKTVESAS